VKRLIGKREEEVWYPADQHIYEGRKEVKREFTGRNKEAKR